MKKLIKMYNEKYGNTLGVIDDDFNKEQMYRIYYFIKNNCDDEEIQARLEKIKLDKPKTLEQQLTKLESENNKVSSGTIDPTIKSDIANIKTDLGDEELTTVNKNVKGAINEVNAQYKDIANKTMTNEERNKLSSLENYDDTEIKKEINGKANKNEVVYKGNGTLNDFDESTRAVLQGLQPGKINAVLGHKNVNYENMNDNSVDYNNFKDKEVGINLFNKYSNFNQDGAMLTADGSVHANAKAMITSHYINVTPSSTIGFFSFKTPITSNLNVVLYDELKNKISVSTNVQGSIETTDNTYYIRFSCVLSNKERYMVKYGTDITNYEDFSVEFNGLKIDNSNIREKSIENNSIKDNTITPNKMVFMEYGKNLLDESKLTDGIQLDNNGNPTSHVATERTTLDFLEVSPNTTFTLTADNIKVVFYDKFKTFLSYVTTNTFTTTEDTCYIRITMHIKSKGTAQLELGNKQTSYEPHCVKIPLLKNDEIENKITNIKGELQKTSNDIIELQNKSLVKKIKVNLGHLFSVDESITASEVTTKTTTSSIDNSIKISSVTENGSINPVFRYCNAQVGKAGETYPRYNYVSSYSVTGSNKVLGGSLMTVEFDADCLEIELITLGTNGKYKLAVDEGTGFKYTYDDTKPLNEANGNQYITKVAFRDKRIRRIRFEIYNSIFGGAYIKPTDSIFPISLPKLPLACYTGSSITEGGYPWYVSQILGMDCINAGVGGTGYVNNGPLNRVKYIDRVDNDLIKPNPDLVVIEGGINDSKYEISEVTSSADELYKYIKEKLPNAKIIIIGMYWSRNADQPTLDMNSALRETALNNQLAYIDLLLGDTILPDGTLVTEGAGAFLTGTGHAGSLKGDGNADIYTSADGTHPTKEGKLYIAQRLATEIYKILQYI